MFQAYALYPFKSSQPPFKVVTQTLIFAIEKTKV